jgi:hypothetical protein
MMWTCGIDLSLTGLGLCAIPSDWDPGSRESWASIRRATLGTKPGLPLVARADLMAQDVVTWIGRLYVKEAPKVCHEGYPIGGRVFNLDKLCEVGGIVKRALWVAMQIDPWPSPQSTARKLICGKLPQRDRKSATLSVLRQMAFGTLDDATDDECDAIVATNLHRKELGLSFAGLVPVEPVKKPSKRRSRTQVGELFGGTT